MYPHKNPKDELITKQQRVKNKLKLNDSNWTELKFKFMSIIDAKLKQRMIFKEKMFGFVYGKGNHKFLIKKISKIRKSWKYDGSVEN